MKIGYARVSTEDQNLDLQIDALKEKKCDHICKEKMSGTIHDRPALDEALNFMRKGDTLVVWKLDRLGRSLRHLIEVINNLMDKGMYFMSLQENIDTTSTSGKLIFHIFAALAEFEREIISERTKAGLKAARVRGRMGGRPKKLNEEQAQMVKKMWIDHTITIDEICRTFDRSRSTLPSYSADASADYGPMVWESRLRSILWQYCARSMATD